VPDATFRAILLAVQGRGTDLSKWVRLACERELEAQADGLLNGQDRRRRSDARGVL
jgi:hypothetical protein